MRKKLIFFQKIVGEEKMDREVIVVAVDASKEITDYALEWAVRNVTKVMDSLILLAVLPAHGNPPTKTDQTHLSRVHHFISTVLKKRSVGQKGENPSCRAGTEQDVKQCISNVFVPMMQRLCSVYNVMRVYTEVKVVADAQLGAVAMKARELQATWLVLDRCLKREAECCIKQMNSNVVLIDHAIPKVLKAVCTSSGKKLGTREDSSSPTVVDMLGLHDSGNPDNISITSQSSLGIESTRSDTDASFSLSLPSSDKEQNHKACRTSREVKSSYRFVKLNSQHVQQNMEATEVPSPLKRMPQPLEKAGNLDIAHSPRKSCSGPLEGIKNRSSFGLLKMEVGNLEKELRKASCMDSKQKAPIPARRSVDSMQTWCKSKGSNRSTHLFKGEYFKKNQRSELLASSYSPTINQISSSKRTISISIKHPQMPPPLCSLCKLKTPDFTKAPKRFSYKEIERATNGFSSNNFLAEGGYGSVYRGVLPDGQVVAVKKHNTLTPQLASEFRSEVEVLSCAQHKNLVILVGYCTERECLLVYEFACNGSLDKHLYGQETKEVMTWQSRMKVAMGAARGLRYLHEDCRVGCIIHRDFRPNNILLTHDFEPMVGDFGLAKLQTDDQLAEESRVIGAFGYLAPEYAKTGLLTEKADVYSFGVVLLELISGAKVTDFLRKTGQQSVLEWARPLLERKMINALIDHRLEQNFVENEVQCMMYAASLCISPYPEQRPKMSKILKILEGDMPKDMAANDLKLHSSNYPKQYMNNMFDIESPSTQSQYMRQEIHHFTQTPPRLSAYEDDNLDIEFEQSVHSSKCNEARSHQGLNESELMVGEEYEAYLKLSLAKFVQNLNEK